MEYGGTIDKFMGDGIMVFFGDPSTKGRNKDALDCIEMAIVMRERVKLLRKKWSQEGIFSELHVRIGIHTGYCTVGNFGCESRMDYTAIGGTVNLASRLEGKASRDGILISGDTYRLTHGQFQTRRRDPVSLKGIKREIEAYDILGLSPRGVQPIDQHAVGFTLSLDLVLADATEVKALLRETICSIETLETRRLEKTAMLRILS